MGTIFVWCIFLFINCCEATYFGNKYLRLPMTRAMAVNEPSGPNSQYGPRNCQKTKRNCVNAYTKITSYFSSQMVSTVSVGTPPQPFEVLFDTGSTDFWITSAKCQETDLGCQVHRGYDSSKSSTYRAGGGNYAMSFYSRGNISGFISMDTVRIGSAQVKNQKFVEVTKEMGAALACTRFDGIFGLGFPSTSISGADPPSLKMYQQGYLTKGVFSFYLRRGQTAGPVGEVTFGGYDTKHFTGKLLYVRLSPTGRWQIPMAGVSVGGRRGEFCARGCQAVLNTGSSFIAGPPQEIKRINQMLGATRTRDGDYFLDCNTVNRLPVVTFTIGNRAFPLQGTDYVVKVDIGGMRCMSGFAEFNFANPEGPMWVLGTTFMTRYYTVFDVGGCKIGLATAA